MTDAPNNQTSPNNIQGYPEKNVPTISGPPTTAIQQPPPAPAKNHSSKKKRRWTKDPAMFWVTLAGVIAVIAYTSVAAWQAYLMRSANEDTHIAAIAARDSAKAAIAANETTRALISASLIIPDDPPSKIRIGLDGTVAIDLYIGNLGQSWAKDVYANVTVTIPPARTSHGQTPFYNQTGFARGFDVSPQTPWHGMLDDFGKYPFAADVVDDLKVSVKVDISFVNMFKEKGSQTAVLIAATGAVNTPCCSIGQLDKFMALQRHM